MYNLLLSALAGLLTFLVVWGIFSPVAGVIPALLVMTITMFLLTRRIGRRIEGEMMKLVPMLQAQQVEPAQAHLRELKARYGRWQVMLSGQIDAQLGMIDYMQRKWDEALPKLQNGRFRNWQAQVCIGAIHYRKGDRDKAWAEFESARRVAPKEVMIYLVHSVLLLKSGDRDGALTVVAEGLKRAPESDLLKRLHKDLANKRQIKPDKLSENWYQFFPEDLVKSQLVRGRRGPQPMPFPQPRMGARSAPRR